jgi:solute carrier family 34 (sodium-dependent phosphate cotransporter)
MTQEPTSVSAQGKPWFTLRIVLLILASLFIFFFAIDLLITSLQHLGASTIETVIRTTSNPFAGLFIGLLVTAMIQSSSTTTALTVAMVASGSLPFSSAVPIIMGANIGTTITSAIVSLGFLNKKKEFKRAVAAGTYHCFFNLLTVLILFPLEYNFGFLSSLATSIGGLLISPDEVTTSNPFQWWSPLSTISAGLFDLVGSSIVLMVVAFILLFASILFFRKFISNLLDAGSPEAFSRFFFSGELRAFAWGLVTTAAIRSSTITTSVVVPMVAKKIVDFRSAAAPFIMGANIGTTVTAFIAALLSSNTSSVSIAIAHFLFNIIGVVIFFPIPALKEIPIRMAKLLGELTYRHRIIGFAFILFTFFILPFSLIYLSQA